LNSRHESRAGHQLLWYSQHAPSPRHDEILEGKAHHTQETGNARILFDSDGSANTKFICLTLERPSLQNIYDFLYILFLVYYVCYVCMYSCHNTSLLNQSFRTSIRSIIYIGTYSLFWYRNLLLDFRSEYNTLFHT